MSLHREQKDADYEADFVKNAKIRDKACEE
jgi:hypothetical protein